jgi:hypothetical protein
MHGWDVSLCTGVVNFVPSIPAMCAYIGHGNMRRGSQKLLSILALRHPHVPQTDESILRDIVGVLAEKMDARILGMPIYPAVCASTMNKERMFIRMRTANGELYPRNVIYAVVIHEFAHMVTAEMDHTPLFWETCKSASDTARRNGVDVVKHDHIPGEYIDSCFLV